MKQPLIYSLFKNKVREAQELNASPSADYTAAPLENDLFEWHFTLKGPPNSVYAEGIYHGRIVLPQAYPLRPPSFRFVTPSGRFETNREICLSISGHHEETWQPAWGVRTALVALRSFMETDAKGQLGGLEATDAVRRRLAAESRAFRCSGCGGRANEEIMKACEEAAREHEAANGGVKGEEVQVPSELKMGWRDEMEKEKKAAEANNGEGAGAGADGIQSTAELAEGFVQTGPLPVQESTATTTSSFVPQPQQQRPPVQRGTVVPPTPEPQLQPTRTVPLTQQHQQHPIAVQRLEQRFQLPMGAGLIANDEGVPAWLDRLIVVLGVVLVGLILKFLWA